LIDNKMIANKLHTNLVAFNIQIHGLNITG